MFTILSFTGIEDKHDVYRNKDCMEKFWESLREHTVEIINLKRKKMKSLTNEQQKSYQKAKNCYNCSEKFEDEHAKDNS